MNVVVLEDVLGMDLFQENEPTSELRSGGTLYAPAFVRRMSAEFVIPPKYKKTIDAVDDHVLWVRGYCLHGFLDSISEFDDHTVGVTMVLLKEATAMSLDEFKLEYLL